MHSIDWGALGSWASFFATIAVAFFVYGRLTENVKHNTEDIREIKEDARDLSKTVTGHTAEIAAIKAHLELDK